MRVVEYMESATIGSVITAKITLSDGSRLSFAPSRELSAKVAGGPLPYGDVMREAMAKGVPA